MKDIEFKKIFAELFPTRWDAANNASSNAEEFYIAKTAFAKGYAVAYEEVNAGAAAVVAEKKRTAKRSASEE